MKKTKLLAVVLLIAVMLLSVVGCATEKAVEQTNEPKSTETKVAEKATEEPKEEVTVVVWTANRHDADYCNEMVAKFNEENKGDVQIEYVIQTDDYINLLTMAASSDQMPDVINMAAYTTGYDIGSFVEAGMIQPLNSYMTNEFKERLSVDNVTFNGINALGDDIYMVPTGMRSGSRFIYNKELFEKAGITELPKNAQEVVEVAKKITEVGGGEQYGYVVPGQSAPMVRMFGPMAKVSGISIYDYKNGRFDFSQYKPIIEFAQQLFVNDSVLPGAASMNMDATRVQFAEGNVGFYGSMSQEYGVLTDQFPAKIEWGASEIPSLTGEIKGALEAGPNMGYLMSAKTKNPEAAWKVIDFFSSDEFVKNYIEAGLNLPLTSRMDSMIDKSKMGKLADFSPVPYESVYPAIPNVSPEGQDWKTALWESCLPNGPDVDETIAALNESYNAALDKEVKMGKIKRLVIKDYDPMKPSAGTFEYLDN